MKQRTDILSLTRTLAPEDISTGMYVAILHETWQLIPCDQTAWRGRIVDPLEVTIRPCDDCHPLRVKAVCLPFVAVSAAEDGTRVLDVRRHRLGAVDPAFARLVWKRLREEKRRAKRKRKRG